MSGISPETCELNLIDVALTILGLLAPNLVCRPIHCAQTDRQTHARTHAHTSDENCAILSVYLAELKIHGFRTL